MFSKISDFIYGLCGGEIIELNQWEIAPDDFHYIVTCSIYKRGKFVRREKYYGNCTVWKTFPDFGRCDVFTCLVLSGFYAKVKYEESKNVI